MLGLGDLLDEIVKLLPEDAPSLEERPPAVSVALVGRPNVGKSSLLNRLLGENRAMVSDIPGTTRDAIDTPYLHPDGTLYNLIDTAGIRRKRMVEDGTIERYSVIRSFTAIRRCDVVLLLIDANDGVTEQDTKIAGIARDEGKACIVIVNKWDAIEKQTGTLEEFQKQVLSRLDFMAYAPVLFISALTGQRTHTLWEEINRVYAQATRRISTGALNDVLGDAQMALQAPMIAGKRLRIYYGIQSGVQPPEFLLFVNNEKLLHFAYERYLENQLRKAFGFEGTPLRLTLREKSEKEVYHQ
jgi:GTP-binding protein